jgi:hypothetical protein
MTTVASINRQNERAPETCVELSEQERALVDQIDEQQAKRQGRSTLVARLLSTPLLAV